ncbi:hybrid sensor histidine kinase/response regulator [Stenotrophomonas rhizophila]
MALLLAWCASAAADVPEAARVTTADGLPSNAVHQVVQDRQGYLWFATDDGLARFDGRTFRTWRREQGLADSALLSLAVDRHDQLWMGTGYGALMRMSADRSRIDGFGGNTHPALAGVPISAVLPDTEGGVWFGTRGAGLFRLDRQQRLRQFLPTLRDDGVPAGDVGHLLVDARGVLWIGTPHGLACWRAGRFHRPPDPRLARAAVMGLHQTAAGVVWVSTARGQWHGTDCSGLQAASGPAHRRLLGIGGDGAHWLAQPGRIWRQPVGGGAATPVRLAAPGQDTRPSLQGAFEDRDGGVWLLGRHVGMWRLPPRWAQFARQPAPAQRRGLDGFLPGSARASEEIACDDGRYWRLHDGMLERRGPARRREVRWALPGTGQAPLRGPVSLHCAADGGVWLGSRDGLMRWNGAQLEPVAGAPAAISALHVAADGQLWVAAEGALHGYQWQQGRLLRRLHLDHRDGVPVQTVHALATDADGVVWGSSSHGLLRVAPPRRGVHVYTRDDGIPSALLKAQLQAQGRQMLAIDADGAIAFDPALLARPATPSALVIERVQVRRDQQLLTLPPAASVQLRAGDREIQITARVLSAQLDPGQQYRFRLRNGEGGWHRTRSRGTVAFPTLAPGRHALDYQERSGEGRWSEAQTLVLHVQPEGWAYQRPTVAHAAGVVAMLGLLVWLGGRALARSRARRATVQRHAWAQQSAQAKARYLATFGHEVRTPLTGVLGMTELLLASPLEAQQRQRLQRIDRGGRQLLAIVNQALDEARLDAGRSPLHCAEVDLAALLQRWRHCAQLDLCLQGSSLAACVDLPGAVRVHTDPARVQQVLQRVVDVMVQTLGACRVSVRASWLPGRSGVLVDVHAFVTAATPLPARKVCRDALEPAQACAHALGGRLQSVGAGGGSGGRVLLSLPMPTGPACARCAPPPEPSSVVVHTAASCHGERVLLVEDEPLVADVHAALLTAGGATVVTAAHALAALGELAVAPFDVVLLDLDLPGVDGWQLLDMLRAQGCPAPVVVLTARRDPDLARRSAAAGAAGWLHKPASGEQLLAAVRAAGRPGRIVAA